MTAVVLLVAAVLAAVAAAGVVRPFGRGRIGRLEPLSDPLSDERAGLLRALRELDADRAAGVLSEQDHRSLRAETEARAVSVLRAIEARDRAGELAAGLRELRPASAAAQARSRRRTAVAVAAGVAFLAVVVPLLAGAVSGRLGGEPITGSTPVASDPLRFFVDRVRAHPDDVAARLDLAQQYLQAGDLEHAIAEYLAALRIDPRNPEARSTLGFLLYRAGRPQDGLDAVNRALAVAPDDPEALYFKGVILLDGLHRPADAAASFRDYLRAAPFGARREEVTRLLGRAEAAASKA